MLLDFEVRSQFELLASLWPARIAYIADSPEDRMGLSALLVRPDGIVAWASDGNRNASEALEAAQLWFGEPDIKDRPK